MARSKGSKVEPRPTLAEVRAQTGKYIFVTYEGTEGGGWALPAPRPRFSGDVVQELMVSPFDPKQIGEEWLDDPRFEELYERVKGIKIWKTDVAPVKPDLNLPAEVASKLTAPRRAMAYLVAVSPFNEAMRELIQTQDRDSGEVEVIRRNHEEVLPFLKAIQFYEKRLLNRPEVMKAIEKRLSEIISTKPYLEKVESL